MTANTSMTPSSGTADWLDVRTAAAKTHDAIWQARQSAIHCRWYEREWAEPVVLALTLVGMVSLFTQPVSYLCEVVVGILLLLPPGLIAGASAARKNALAQSYKSPLTDAELQSVAFLPISSKTPGWDGWMAAAADHRLGLADLENLIRAIDDHQEVERQRRVLRHQNQIVFRDQETEGSTA